MPYGTLTTVMEHTLRSHVQGQVVWDLGAGDLAWSQRLVQLGAKKVVAVDKEPMQGRPGKVEIRKGYFHDIEPSAPDIIPVAFLSWPANYPQRGLLELLDRALKVIYLGKNTDGSACGWPVLFANFYFRNLLAHVPHKGNSLLVYDTYRLPNEGPRRLVAEEYAPLQPEMLSWEEVEGKTFDLPGS